MPASQTPHKASSAPPPAKIQMLVMLKEPMGHLLPCLGAPHFHWWPRGLHIAQGWVLAAAGRRMFCFFKGKAMPSASVNVQHLVLFVPCCSTAELLQEMYQCLVQCFFFITVRSACLQAPLPDIRSCFTLRMLKRFPPHPHPSSPTVLCPTGKKRMLQGRSIPKAHPHIPSLICSAMQ